MEEHQARVVLDYLIGNRLLQTALFPLALRIILRTADLSLGEELTQLATLRCLLLLLLAFFFPLLGGLVIGVCLSVHGGRKLFEVVEDVEDAVGAVLKEEGADEGLGIAN